MRDTIQEALGILNPENDTRNYERKLFAVAFLRQSLEEARDEIESWRAINAWASAGPVARCMKHEELADGDWQVTLVGRHASLIVFGKKPRLQALLEAADWCRHAEQLEAET